MKTLTLTVQSLERPHFAHDDAFLHGIEWGRHDRRPMHSDDWEYFSWLRTKYGFARVDRPRLTTPQEANMKLDGTTKTVVGLTLQSNLATLLDGTVIRTCPNSGRCVAPCVGSNGNGAYPKVQAARDARTEYFATEPNMAFFHVGYEVGRTMRKHGAVEFRPKVNDDMDWATVCPSVGKVDGLIAYGYTKLHTPTSTLNWNGTGGYVEAYSLNETTDPDTVQRYLDNGVSIAAVTDRKKGEPIQQWAHRYGWNALVIDADYEDDWMVTAARNNQPVIGDLSAKGRAPRLGRAETPHIRTKGHFVQPIYRQA